MVTGTGAATSHACRKVAPASFELVAPESPVLNMDAFLTAQLTNGESCAARMLETSRTLDGLEQQVQSLRYEHALSVRKQDDGRATLQAAQAQSAEGAGDAATDTSVAEATQAVFEAEQEILGLEAYILDAEKEAEKVAELLANLRRSCRDDGEVTKHLEKLRWIIQVLPPCPGRNDFKLKIPEVPGLEGPRTGPQCTTGNRYNPRQLMVYGCDSDVMSEGTKFCIRAETFTVGSSFDSRAGGGTGATVNLADGESFAPGLFTEGDALTVGACSPSSSLLSFASSSNLPQATGGLIATEAQVEIFADCGPGYTMISPKTMDGEGKELTSDIENVMQCVALCNARASCTGIEFSLEQNQCWTYRGGATVVQSTSNPAEWQTCFKTPCGPGYTRITPQRLDGLGEQSTQNIDTILQCADICDARPGCTSIEYGYASKECTTYTGGDSNRISRSLRENSFSWETCVKPR